MGAFSLGGGGGSNHQGALSYTLPVRILRMKPKTILWMRGLFLWMREGAHENLKHQPPHCRCAGQTQIGLFDFDRFCHTQKKTFVRILSRGDIGVMCRETPEDLKHPFQSNASCDSKSHEDIGVEAPEDSKHPFPRWWGDFFPPALGHIEENSSTQRVETMWKRSHDEVRPYAYIWANRKGFPATNE